MASEAIQPQCPPVQGCTRSGTIQSEGKHQGAAPELTPSHSWPLPDVSATPTWLAASQFRSSTTNPAAHPTRRQRHTTRLQHPCAVGHNPASAAPAAWLRASPWGAGAGGGHICTPSPAEVLPLARRAKPRCTHFPRVPHRNGLQPSHTRVAGRDKHISTVSQFLVGLHLLRKPLKTYFCASTARGCSGPAQHYTEGPTPGSRMSEETFKRILLVRTC